MSKEHSHLKQCIIHISTEHESLCFQVVNKVVVPEEHPEEHLGHL